MIVRRFLTSVTLWKNCRSAAPIVTQSRHHHLFWRLPCLLPRNSRCQRRGKQGGISPKLRTYLECLCRNLCHLQVKTPTVFEGYDLRSSSEFRYRWLRLIPRDIGTLLPCCRPVRISLRGCVPGNLRSLHCFALPTGRPLVRSALINTRSLTNKTVILNDFFSTHDLDVLLQTEIWLKPGECSAFLELLPPGCYFFSTPRATGRGGGQATVFKDSSKCRIITTNDYSSFELQLFSINHTPPVLCATLYRPPRF